MFPPRSLVSLFKGWRGHPRMRASDEGLLSSASPQRSRQTGLQCAHRTSTVSSCAFCEQEGWSGDSFPILPSSLVTSSRGWPGLVPTAHVERPQFHRGHSVSTAINAPTKLARYRPEVVRPGRSSIARVERGPSEGARSASRKDDQAALLPPISTRPPPKSPPVPAESPLPCSPILAFLNPSVRMPKIGTADPPEERKGPDTGKEGDPETQASEMWV